MHKKFEILIVCKVIDIYHKFEKEILKKELLECNTNHITIVVQEVKK